MDQVSGVARRFALSGLSESLQLQCLRGPPGGFRLFLIGLVASFQKERKATKENKPEIPVTTPEVLALGALKKPVQPKPLGPTIPWIISYTPARYPLDMLGIREIYREGNGRVS